MEAMGNLFSTSVKLFALMTPPAVLSAYISGTRECDRRHKRSIAFRTAGAVLIIGCVLYLLGEELFSLFGFTLDAFRIGSGALLFMTAVSLMNETASTPRFSPEEDDISVVPLAIPLCMGPATIGTVMVWGATAQGLSAKATGILALFIASSGIYGLLFFADEAERVLKRTGIAILSKLTGLLLAAIAAQVVFTGVRSFMQ